MFIKVIIPEESYDYYVYPVFSDKQIIATIHVSKVENEIGYTYTKALVKELEALKSETSKSTPLLLIRQGAFLYAEIGESRTLLEYHPISKSEVRNSISHYDLPSVDESNLEVTNLYNDLTFNNASSVKLPRLQVNKLSWYTYETQPSDKPWCASITTANIVRNNTGRYVTSAQMRSYLNSNSALLNSQVNIYLSKGLGMSNVGWFNVGPLSQFSIEAEVNSGRAVYAGFMSGFDGHALAVFGYNNVAGAYYIHNPWYTGTETMRAGDVYVAGGRSWKWSGGSVYRIY